MASKMLFLTLHYFTISCIFASSWIIFVLILITLFHPYMISHIRLRLVDVPPSLLFIREVSLSFTFFDTTAWETLDAFYGYVLVCIKLDPQKKYSRFQLFSLQQIKMAVSCTQRENFRPLGRSTEISGKLSENTRNISDREYVSESIYPVCSLARAGLVKHM